MSGARGLLLALAGLLAGCSAPPTQGWTPLAEASLGIDQEQLRLKVEPARRVTKVRLRVEDRELDLESAQLTAGGEAVALRFPSRLHPGDDPEQDLPRPLLVDGFDLVGRGRGVPAETELRFEGWVEPEGAADAAAGDASAE